MATSGSTDFELDVSDYIEEAFERCGSGGSHRLRLQDSQTFFEPYAGRMGKPRLESVDDSGAVSNYDRWDRCIFLGTDVIDILSAVVRRSSIDYALERISRDAYQNIPTKSTDGRPSYVLFWIVR